MEDPNLNRSNSNLSNESGEKLAQYTRTKNMLPKLLKEFAAENSKSFGHHKLDSSVSRPMGSRYDELSGQYDRTLVDINPEVLGFGQAATRNQKNIAINRKARISVDLGFSNFGRQKPKEDKPLEIEKIIDTHTVQHKQQKIKEKQEEEKKQLKFETADKVNKIDKLTSEQIYEMVYEVVPEDEYEKKDNPSDSSATPQNSKMTKTPGNTLEKRPTFGSIANQESKNGSQTAFRKGNTNASLVINSKSESQDSIEIGLHRSPQKKPNQNHQTTKRPSLLKRQATSTTANFRHHNSRASLALPAGAVKSATASPHARSRVYDAAKRGGLSTTNAENNYEVEEKSDKARESFSRVSVAAVRQRSETKLDDVAKSTDQKVIPISVSWGPQKSQINKNSTLKNKRGLNRLATFNVIDDIKEASIEAEELISPRKELALNSELESPFGKSRVASLNFIGNYDLSFASLQSSYSQTGHKETIKEQISVQNDSSSRGSPTPVKISLIRYGLNQNRLSQNLIEENPEKEDEYTSKVDLNDNDKRKINARRATTQKISAPSTPGLKKPIKSNTNRLLKIRNSEIKLVKDTISQIGLPQPAQRNLISEFPSVDSKDATPHPPNPPNLPAPLLPCSSAPLLPCPRVQPLNPSSFNIPARVA